MPHFNHPSQDRDFAKTDEALRVRLDGDQAMFTYEGPRVDSVTKTRQELELQVANPGDSGESMKQFLQTLGFIYVHSVVKQRRKGKLVFQNQTVEVALDEVEGLGLFIEFEIVTGEEELKAATDLLVRLSESLSLGDGITVGYLDLLCGNVSPYRGSGKRKVKSQAMTKRIATAENRGVGEPKKSME